MASKLFSRGYDSVREEKERVDRVRESAGNRLWTFFLKDDRDEARIRFLLEEPSTFNVHVVRDSKNFETVVCKKEGCRYCEDGDKPSFKGAYLIIDKREIELTNKKTNKKERRNATLRLYIVGTQVLSQLDRLSSKYGLTKRDFTIARNGSGQNTTYSFDPEEPSKITKEEISNLMTEKMREQYDGSTESLINILEGQLELMVDNGTVTEDTEEPEKTKQGKNLVDVDDDGEEIDTSAKADRKPKIRPPSVKNMFRKNG